MITLEKAQKIVGLNYKIENLVGNKARIQSKGDNISLYTYEQGYGHNNYKAGTIYGYYGGGNALTYSGDTYLCTIDKGILLEMLDRQIKEMTMELESLTS